MSDDWREELIERMARASAAHSYSLSKDVWNELLRTTRKRYLDEARAALAVAEPVIREKADAAIREENVRLREELEALKKFEREKWTGWAAREGGKNDRLA